MRSGTRAETAKTWYARMKSRPSFRPLLAERLPDDAERGLRQSRLLTRLREKARALGFDACRSRLPSSRRRRVSVSAAWLAKGCRGDMA